MLPGMIFHLLIWLEAGGMPLVTYSHALNLNVKRRTEAGLGLGLG